MKQKQTTGKVLKAFYTVYNRMGYGFLEKVYENAMFLELKQSGCNVRKQYPIKVYYNTEEVGEYFADLLVDETVIVELKAAEVLAEEHELQLLNYLRATDAEVGLVLNFGRKPQFRRKLFENQYKKRAV